VNKVGVRVADDYGVSIYSYFGKSDSTEMDDDEKSSAFTCVLASQIDLIAEILVKYEI